MVYEKQSYRNQVKILNSATSLCNRKQFKPVR